MRANRDLDQMLERLRQRAAPAVSLEDIESGVWQQIELRMVQMQRPKARLALVLASVAAAFVWGVFSASDIPERAPGARAFLVEEVDPLPPDLGGLLL